MKLGRRTLMVSLAAALAGCGLRPLYSGGGDSGVQAELSSVAIPEPQTRLGQLIRNDLVSAMRPEGAGRYALLIVPSLQEETSVVNDSTDTLRLVVRVSASYTLSEVGSGKPLASGKTFSQTSYDETGQSFADKQAKADAMARAAKEVAQDILTRVSGYFAGRKP
jgi:LPS-assembly lipoprotein